MKTLAIRHETALPMREISALTVRSGESGGPELLAVGDEDFGLVSAQLDDDGAPARTRRHELFLPLVGTGIGLRSGSGFEGVASDGEGSVLILQEEEARLLVFPADLSQLLQVLELAVPEEPGFGAAWHAKTNARGEGLLLLEGGHLLIAKQKEPAYLIEFGPAGDTARGISAGTVLAAGARFERPNDELGRLVPLAAWELGEDTAKTLPTINDIAFGDDGRVYLLSAEAQLIAQLEERLEPGERARATDSWRIDGTIPGGEDARPEGLVVLGKRTPVIGIDSKLAGSNLVVLDPPGG
jgi:hypothetical protein